MDKQAFQKLAKIHSQKPVIMGYKNGKRFCEFDGHKFAIVIPKTPKPLSFSQFLN